MPDGDTDASSTERLLAERYGDPRPQRRMLAIAAVVVLALAGLAWVGWAAWQHATPDVRGELHSFEIVSDHEVEVVVDIERTNDDAVTCTVQAQAEDHAIVADQEVTVPAGADESTRSTFAIPTERRATAATVTNCHQ